MKCNQCEFYLLDTFLSLLFFSASNNHNYLPSSKKTGKIHPATLYTLKYAGATHILALGGIQVLVSTPSLPSSYLSPSSSLTLSSSLSGYRCSCFWTLHRLGGRSHWYWHQHHYDSMYYHTTITLVLLSFFASEHS